MIVYPFQDITTTSTLTIQFEEKDSNLTCQTTHVSYEEPLTRTVSFEMNSTLPSGDFC